MAAPSNTHRQKVLKVGPKRTVSMVPMPSGEWRVTKRFHGPGIGGVRAIGAPADWRRARSEAHALGRAHGMGLPVPRPLGVARSRDGRWELTMESVAGGRPLAEVLSDASSSTEAKPPEIAALATRLGSLLRKLESAGFVHADPHPANLLVDDHGELWIVDVARSQVGASPARVQASIVRALSRTRELSTRSFRRRVALAWLGTEATPEWTRGIEAEATRLRSRELHDRVSVWRRTSSATEVRRDHGGLPHAVWVRERPQTPPRGWATRRLSGTSAEVGAVWETLVRAKLHRLPACEPRALALSHPYAVVYDAPAETRAPSREATTRLLRQLHSRGLTVEPRHIGADKLIAAPDGVACIAPTARLVELPATPEASAP